MEGKNTEKRNIEKENTAERLFEAQLLQLSEFIADAIGLYFPKSRWSDLERSMIAVARALHFEDVCECVKWVLSTPRTKDLLETLADHLTVGETYFFRDKKSFQTLSQEILPIFARRQEQGKRSLRIWSAGCCTGEEPYSIAILLKRTIPDLEEWNVKILATDLNTRFLKIATTGTYGKWSFRDTPEWLREEYFTKTAEGRFTIHPQIQQMVHFAYLNLVENVYPSLTNDTNAMDVIFCRNVLMYFTTAQMEKVIQNFFRAQREGGWLITSPSESSHVLLKPYSVVSFPEAIVYQKDVNKEFSIPKYNEDINFVERISELPLLLPEEPTFLLSAETPSLFLQEKSQNEKQDPQPPSLSSSLLFEEATLFYNDGSYGEAAKILITAALTHSLEPPLFSLLARSLANQGELSQAQKWCEEWILHDKLNPSAYFLHATILQEQGNIDDAVSSLQRALYVAPEFVLAHFTLGNFARYHPHLGNAEKHLKNALQLLEDNCTLDHVLPDADGVTAAQLIEIIQALLRVGSGENSHSQTEVFDEALEGREN